MCSIKYNPFIRTDTRPRRRGEQGVALLTALLIVALATIAAVAFSSRQKLTLRLTSNVLTSDQAYMYAIGGEYWARGQLARDNEKDKKEGRVDALNEEWTKPLPPTTIETGKISANIQDAMSKFNLNNLYLHKNPAPEEKEDFVRQYAYFQRLLRLLEVDENIAQPIADWIDEDIDTRFPDGAEDLEYLNLDPPYRTANRRMTSITELRLVKGVSEEVYEKIAPYVTVLPESTPLNINTADVLLIQALLGSVDAPTLEPLLDERKEEAFRTKKEFIDRLKALLSDNSQNMDEIEGLIEVGSVYYVAQTEVQVERIHMQLTSLIYKDPTSDPHTVMRSRGGL